MVVRALSLGLVFAVTKLGACELCGVYNADAASSGWTKGLTAGITEMYVPYRTVQLDGEELPPSILDETYLIKSTSHVIPTWNFSERFGISLSLPIIYESFDFFQLTPSAIDHRSGTKAGIGDLSLIGRYQVFRSGKGATM